MILLPYDKFEVQTFLSKNDARKRIEALLVPKPSFTQVLMNSFDNMFKKSGAEQFIGNIDDDGFSIRRLIYYRNSFLPVVKGIFEGDSRGTKLQVTMTLHPAVMIFMLAWFLGVLSMTLLTLYLSMSRGFHPAFLIPVAMLVFGWFIVQFGFFLEAKKAKKILFNVFSNAAEQVTAADNARGSSGAPLAKS